LERGEELHRLQRRLAPRLQRLVASRAGKQALVLAQGLFDLLVARQRGIVMDPQPLRGLELGLVVVTDAGLADQPRGLVGQLLAALAGADLGVLAGMLHGLSSALRPADSN